MAKCTKCGKEIKNTYWLNGKAYGYNCYKQELAMILAEKERLANEKYQLDVAVTIEILKNRTKLNDFLKSIINFYEEKGFLSYKQVECIKLTNQEKFEKWLTVYEMSDNQDRKEEIRNIIYESLKHNNRQKDININDDRLINIIKNIKNSSKRLSKRNFSLYKFKRENTIITTISFNKIEDIIQEISEDRLHFIEGIEL